MNRRERHSNNFETKENEGQSMSDQEISRALDNDIALTHERLVQAMAVRVPLMPLDQKERYFSVLSALVGKLETPEKAMREILQEMMTEAASLILQELQG